MSSARSVERDSRPTGAFASFFQRIKTLFSRLKRFLGIKSGNVQLAPDVQPPEAHAATAVVPQTKPRSVEDQIRQSAQLQSSNVELAADVQPPGADVAAAVVPQAKPRSVEDQIAHIAQLPNVNERIERLLSLAQAIDLPQTYGLVNYVHNARTAGENGWLPEEVENVIAQDIRDCNAGRPRDERWMRTQRFADIRAALGMSPDSEIQGRLDEELYAAVSRGNTARVKALLRGGADAKRENSWALFIAATKGHAETLRALLDGGAEPRADESIALRRAAAAGHTDVVRVLLDDGRAEPAAEQSASLRCAALNGRTEIVRALLKDGRADPLADDSNALNWAVAAGHTDVVLALLADGRAEPANRNSLPLSVAAHNGNTEIVCALLNDGRVDPEAAESYALREAARRGHPDVVRALLDDGRADPAAMGGSALCAAAHNGCAPLVRALLVDGRSNAAGDRALALAAKNGQTDSMLLLLAAVPAAERPMAADGTFEQALPQPAATLARACKDDPATQRMLDVIQALLKTDVPTEQLLALAHEAGRRDIKPEAVLHLQARDLLRSVHGIPSTAAIAQLGDLTALASVSKAGPVLRSGQVPLDVAQYPAILEALAPTLPPYVTAAVWQTLRAQARGEEPARAYGMPAQRVRHRMAGRVLVEAAVKEYNALSADVKKHTAHADHLLSAAANHFLRALNALSDAMDRADPPAIATARSQVDTTMQTYEERASKVLGEANSTRARRSQLVRSIARMKAEHLAEFARALARQRTARKALAMDV